MFILDPEEASRFKSRRTLVYQSGEILGGQPISKQHQHKDVAAAGIHDGRVLSRTPSSVGWLVVCSKVVLN